MPTGRQIKAARALPGLADWYMASLLEDPTFDPAKLARALGTSRASLYSTLAERDGVAAAIRNARLDRARQQLAAPSDQHRALAEVAFV